MDASFVKTLLLNISMETHVYHIKCVLITSNNVFISERLHYFKAAVLQLKNNKGKSNKINGKYWSSYVQWRNLLLLTINSVDKIVGKTSFFFA